MATELTKAWAFLSGLSMKKMKEALDSSWREPWAEGDSAWNGDYLAKQITPEAIARIYERGDGFIVKLLFETASPDADAERQLAAAEQTLMQKVIAPINARDVRECEPPE